MVWPSTRLLLQVVDLVVPHAAQYCTSQTPCRLLSQLDRLIILVCRERVSG